MPACHQREARCAHTPCPVSTGTAVLTHGTGEGAQRQKLLQLHCSEDLCILNSSLVTKGDLKHFSFSTASYYTYEQRGSNESDCTYIEDTCLSTVLNWGLKPSNIGISAANNEKKLEHTSTAPLGASIN